MLRGMSNNHSASFRRRRFSSSGCEARKAVPSTLGSEVHKLFVERGLVQERCSRQQHGKTKFCQQKGGTETSESDSVLDQRQPFQQALQQFWKCRPTSKSQEPELVAAADMPSVETASEIVQRAEAALSTARNMHQQDRDEDAVEILAEWLNEAGRAGPVGPDAVRIQQAMIALGCWLCNRLATKHLHARRVARAFGHTRVCQRWLAMRVDPQALGGRTDHGTAQMWLQLEFDCTLNSAELANASDDGEGAIAALANCQDLSEGMDFRPDPEAVHLCLAEVLLRAGRHAEAAISARHASNLLRAQQIPGDGRKLYSLLFALSLEQSALSTLSDLPGLPPLRRSLLCLQDAEAAWHEGGYDAIDPGPPQALLERMRTVHAHLLSRVRGTPCRHTRAPVRPMRRHGSSPSLHIPLATGSLNCNLAASRNSVTQKTVRHSSTHMYGWDP